MSLEVRGIRARVVGPIVSVPGVSVGRSPGEQEAGDADAPPPVPVSSDASGERRTDAASTAAYFLIALPSCVEAPSRTNAQPLEAGA